MVIRYVILVFVVLSIFAETVCASGDKGVRTRMAKYLVGLKYLDQSPTISREDRVAYYRKIEKLTGVTAQDFSNFMMQFKNRPKEYEKFIEIVQKSIDVNSNKKE